MADDQISDIRRPFVTGPYYETPDQKQAFLRRIFDSTAPYYEGIARWGWFGTGARYRREALTRAGITPEMKVVDVASGTGPVARALLEIGVPAENVTCVEPSAGMIAESRKTVPCTHHQSTAETLPLPDQSADFVVMGFALRHVDDLTETFAEFFRVLKPGGQVLIMDVTMPDNPVGRWFFKLYFKHILPDLTLVFSWNRDAYRLMRYYWETMEQMTPRDEVTGLMREAGFSEAGHKVLLGCFSEYSATR